MSYGVHFASWFRMLTKLVGNFSILESDDRGQSRYLGDQPRPYLHV